MATWYRGRFGATDAGSSNLVLNLRLHTFAPGNGETIYRIIADYCLDLIANDVPGSLNSGSPATIGMTFTTSSGSSPAAPVDGPKTNPSGYSLWWQGITYSSIYGFPPGGATGAFAATGRIDRDVKTTPNQELYSSLWLTCEFENSAGDWSEALWIGWGNILTMPTA